MINKQYEFKDLPAGIYSDRVVRGHTTGDFTVFVHEFQDGVKYFHFRTLWLPRDQAYDLCGAFYCGLFAKDENAELQATG